MLRKNISQGMMGFLLARRGMETKTWCKMFRARFRGIFWSKQAEFRPQIIMICCIFKAISKDLLRFLTTWIGMWKARLAKNVLTLVQTTEHEKFDKHLRGIDGNIYLNTR